MYPIELKEKISNIIKCGYGYSLKTAMIKNNIDINYLIYLTSFLPKLSGIPERIYCILNDINKIQICNNRECNNVVLFIQYVSGYRLYCCNKCGTNSISVKEKRKTTNIDKYGCENVFQSENIKDKCIDTNLKNFGVENASKSDIIKNKKIETCLKNYGVKHPLQSKIIYEKIKETNLIKYGVEYNSQNSNIHDKQHKIKFKNYILPSGKEVKIQGYENRFLDEYFNSGGLESNILIKTKDINDYLGIIWYQGFDDKKHRYYPDCYLINENKIVEVKSNWTYLRDKDENELKKQTCLDKGLNFEFRIYGGNL